MHNNDIQDLTKRNADPIEYLKEQDNLNKDQAPQSWEDYFAKMFTDPLEYPKHVMVLVRRHLPADSPINEYHVDLQIPFMFGMDDQFGRRWLGYLYDTTDKNGWRFILMMPDPYVYLNYLANKVDLQQVYDSVTDGNFYICQPDMSDHLISIKRTDIPETATPAEHSMYDNNIWLDKSDLTSGMNVEDVYNIQNLAQNNKFYPEDDRYLNSNDQIDEIANAANTTNSTEDTTAPEPNSSTSKPLEGSLVDSPKHTANEVDNEIF